MNLVEKALIFATHAHEGQKRKFQGTPYILHPAEVAAIIATMTDDEEVIASGCLHDTVEDCGVLPETILAEFGKRVYSLVCSETEDKLSERPEEETWMERKQDSLLMLKLTKDRDVKIMWLADKLSNIRSFYRTYLEIGDKMWDVLHQKDPLMQRWYYETVAKYTIELKDTAAYMEFEEIIHKLFDRYLGNADE